MASSELRDLEQVVRDGLSTLVLGFGYRVGIVDGLLKIEQPCTAEKLAQKVGMKRRYIEEWLSCMGAAGIIKVHEDGRFSLPHDEAKLRMQCHIAGVIPTMCESMPLLEQVLKTDGPRGYKYTEPFLKFVEGFATPAAIENWVKNSLEPVLKLKEGDKFTMLDLGCGYGRHSIRTAQLYPESSVYGVDMDQISIDRANEAKEKNSIKNVEFICISGGNLPSDWSEKFDFVIINQVLHDAPGIDAILKETKRVLKPDGYGAAYDPPVSSHPVKQVNEKWAQQALPFSFFSCLPMSLSDPKETGDGLGVGWGYENRKAKIEEHGFSIVPCGDIDINTVQERIVFKTA